MRMEWIACLAVHAQYLNAQMGNAGNNDAGTGKGGGEEGAEQTGRIAQASITPFYTLAHKNRHWLQQQQKPCNQRTGQLQPEPLPASQLLTS